MSARGLSAAVLAAVLIASPTAGARGQGGYRVALAMAGTAKVSFVEFRPCVPAEGSDCGAWIDRVADTSVDHAVEMPALVLRAVAPNGADSAVVDGNSVRLIRLARANASSRRVAYHAGAARAIAMSNDSRYAFAVFDGLDAPPTAVVMIDLDTQSVIASLRLSEAVAGVAMLP